MAGADEKRVYGAEGKDGGGGLEGEEAVWRGVCGNRVSAAAERLGGKDSWKRGEGQGSGET